MRPETFRSKMNKAFDTWYSDETDISQFFPLLREMKRVWKKLAKEGDDCRSGEETYGYKTFDSIDNNLMYISDRWRCAFRLRWLIDGIENGKIQEALTIQNKKPITILSILEQKMVE